MAKLQDGSRVYGTLIVDTAIVASSGVSFKFIDAITTTGSGTYTLPAALQVPGAKFKLTIVGAGGQGGGCPASSGAMGGGGASGAVVVVIITVVSGLYTFTYTVGNVGTAAGTNAAGIAGNASTVTYNSVTYTAGGGAGGTLASTNSISTGGTASGGLLNMNGWSGGASGTLATNISYFGIGADTPLGWGMGGYCGTGAASTPYSDGIAASGYGAGGGGANGTAVNAGGVGTQGIIVIEY